MDEAEGLRRGENSEGAAEGRGSASERVRAKERARGGWCSVTASLWSVCWEGPRREEEE